MVKFRGIKHGTKTAAVCSVNLADNVGDTSSSAQQRDRLATTNFVFVIHGRWLVSALNHGFICQGSGKFNPCTKWLTLPMWFKNCFRGSIITTIVGIKTLWWYSTVVRTSVYDWRTFRGLHHDLQLTGDLLGVNRQCMSANMANSAVHPLGVDKWVVSWTQAFAMHICVVAPPGECLRAKADMVLFAGNTVWSISEPVRGVHKDALYKSLLPLPFTLYSVHGSNSALLCQNMTNTAQH